MIISSYLQLIFCRTSFHRQAKCAKTRETALWNGRGRRSDTVGTRWARRRRRRKSQDCRAAMGSSSFHEFCLS